MRIIGLLLVLCAALAYPTGSASATSASMGSVEMPALAPDGSIRFVTRNYYCYNRTRHEDALPQVLVSPLRWESKDAYCRFTDEKCYPEDFDCTKKTTANSAEHRKKDEVNPFRAAGLRISMAGYRCPVILRFRGKPKKRFAEALRKSGLDDYEKLIDLAVETLERNLVDNRLIDCGLVYKKLSERGVDVSRLPKRFNQTVPDLCFEKDKKKGSAADLLEEGRTMRKKGNLDQAAALLHRALQEDCTNVDALLERAIIYALGKHSYQALGLLDRLYQQDVGRAFAAYREIEAFQKMPRRYSWNRFLTRYERWTREGCRPSEKGCKPPPKKKK
jgi:tetratricopeptide (TPR) repeat protein